MGLLAGISPHYNNQDPSIICVGSRQGCSIHSGSRSHPNCRVQARSEPERRAHTHTHANTEGVRCHVEGTQMRRSPILSLNVSQKSGDKCSLSPAPLLRPAPQCCQSCCGLRSCSRSILDILPAVRALTMPSSGATRRPGLSMRTQCPRRISRPNAEPKFSFYVPTRTNKKRELPPPTPTPPPPPHIWSQKDNVFGAQRRAKKKNKKKKTGDYFTHYCTGDEQRSPETRFIPQLLGRADIGGACQLP